MFQKLKITVKELHCVLEHLISDHKYYFSYDLRKRPFYHTLQTFRVPNINLIKAGKRFLLNMATFGDKLFVGDNVFFDVIKELKKVNERDRLYPY